tara:strand:+ start:5819 stop:6187 length:369 start_codon:yes stop_codon:yes gene_type:complete
MNNQHTMNNVTNVTNVTNTYNPHVNNKQWIKISEKQTPKGEYFEDLVYEDDGKLYHTKYRYYTSSNTSKTAHRLCLHDFELDHVNKKRVTLKNKYSKETADIWTSTGEVEIYSKCQVDIVRV